MAASTQCRAQADIRPLTQLSLLASISRSVLARARARCAARCQAGACRYMYGPYAGPIGPLRSNDSWLCLAHHHRLLEASIAAAGYRLLRMTFHNDHVLMTIKQLWHGGHNRFCKVLRQLGLQSSSKLRPISLVQTVSWVRFHLSSSCIPG